MATKTASWVRVKERIPYNGKGVDNLLNALRIILEQNRYAQKIQIEVGSGHILLEKLVSEEQAAETQTSWHDSIRAHKLEEYKPSANLTPHQQLWEVFQIIHVEGLEVGQIVVGDKHQFQGWLGTRIPLTKMNFFGIPITQASEIPHEIFIVCGTEERESDPEDVVFSVKGSLT